MESEAAALKWMYFLVQLAGNTAGAHLDFVKKLTGIGHVQVNTLVESDYLLLFCPIVSRAGTDVADALAEVSGDKPIIVVVMYHTFTHDYMVPNITRYFDNPNILLIVSCLFYNGQLLKCKQNDIAWCDVHKFLRAFAPQISPFRAVVNWFCNRKLPCACVSVLVVSLITLIVWFSKD